LLFDTYLTDILRQNVRQERINAQLKTLMLEMWILTINLAINR